MSQIFYLGPGLIFLFLLDRAMRCTKVILGDMSFN